MGLDTSYDNHWSTKIYHIDIHVSIYWMSLEIDPPNTQIHDCLLSWLAVPDLGHMRPCAS